LADPRAYPLRPFVAVSAAIIRDRRVLVVRRARSPARGLFTLPGGVVEPGLVDRRRPPGVFGGAKDDDRVGGMQLISTPADQDAAIDGGNIDNHRHQQPQRPFLPQSRRH